MTTITVAHPTKTQPKFVVFGSYDGPDDRFVFGHREITDREAADAYAKRLMELHAADHFERMAT